MKTFFTKISMIFLLSIGISHGSNHKTKIEERYDKTTPLVPKDVVDFTSSTEVDLSQVVDGITYLKDEVEIGSHIFNRYGLIHQPGFSFEYETEVSVTFYYMHKDTPPYVRDNLLLHIVASFERWKGILPVCYSMSNVTKLNSKMKNLVQHDVFFELDRLFATHPDLSEGLFKDELEECEEK